MDNNSTINMEAPKKPLSMNPKKFALWLFMVSIIMIFAALTSAYIVRQADGEWYVFDMPNMFYYSTVVILLSSATMHWSLLQAKKDQLPQMKQGLLLTTVLGVIFILMQYWGWDELVNINVYFVGNPSGSFVYVLTGLHALHLLSGIIFLLIVLVKALQSKVHSKRLLSIEMCTSYWHFLDGLWLYLFIFMLLNR